MDASTFHNDIQEKLSHTFDAGKLLNIFDQFTSSLVENEKKIAELNDNLVDASGLLEDHRNSDLKSDKPSIAGLLLSFEKKFIELNDFIHGNESIEENNPVRRVYEKISSDPLIQMSSLANYDDDKKKKRSKNPSVKKDKTRPRSG